MQYASGRTGLRSLAMQVLLRLEKISSVPVLQTLIKSIGDLTEDKIEYEISPGRADIHYRDLSEEGMLLVDSFFIGVCSIADEFPDYVRIE